MSTWAVFPAGNGEYHDSREEHLKVVDSLDLKEFCGRRQGNTVTCI